MSTKLESLKYAVRRLIPSTGEKSEELNKALDQLFAKLTEVNKHNFDAILPLRQFDMGQVEIHWPDMAYGEDYVCHESINYEDPVEGRWVTADAADRDELIEKIDEEIDGLKRLALSGAALSAAPAKLGTLLALVALKDNIEQADAEPTELMWNYSWRPDDRTVDKSIVNTIPQITWVAKLTDSASQLVDSNGDAIPGAAAASGTYLTLSCIGQDNSPALMAYAVLAFGVVPEQYSRCWQDLTWTRAVIGDRCLRACATKLGVLPALEYHDQQEAAKKRHDAKAFAEAEARKEAIRRRPLSRKLAAFLKAEVNIDVDVMLYAAAANIEARHTSWLDSKLEIEVSLLLSAYGRLSLVRDLLNQKTKAPDEH
jgi:hypothetical protein